MHRDVRRRCLSGDRSSWSSSYFGPVFTLWVPACALLRCQRTTRCRMSARGSRPKIASFRSTEPGFAVKFDHISFHCFASFSAGAASAAPAAAVSCGAGPLGKATCQARLFHRVLDCDPATFGARNGAFDHDQATIASVRQLPGSAW